MQPRSAIGFGQVRHRRHSPRAHNFSYAISMPLLDLDELPRIIQKSRWWSLESRNWVSWRRSDYLGDTQRPLKLAVQDKAEELLGWRPEGRVLQLAQPRHVGYTFNPIALYFCFDQSDQLCACLAEVTSTPWKERICYAMAVPRGQSRWQHTNSKAMHVSPFLPMDMDYSWRIHASDKRLNLHIENWRKGERVFDATLALNLEPVTRQSLSKAAFGLPFMTLKTIAAIHWQALLLWLKGVPFIPRSEALKSS